MAFIIFYFFLLKKLKKLFFLGLILRYSKLNVQHKGVLMQDWVFRLGLYLFQALSSLGSLISLYFLLQSIVLHCKFLSSMTILTYASFNYNTRAALTNCSRVAHHKPCQYLIHLQGLGSFQLADHLENEINQDPYYVKNIWSKI